MPRSGIPVPAVIPDESRAFTLCVPDSPEFMGIVMGAIKIMTFGYYWQGSEEQVSAVKARMLQMYYSYQEQNGCMDCNQVTECIENDEGTRQALSNLIGQLNPTGEQSPFGEPLSPGQIAANIAEGTNPSCNLDVLFGQCRAIVQYTNRAIVDTLETIEVAANSVELADALSSALPVAGVTLDAAGISGVLQLVNYYQNAIAEQYAAQYTLSVENEIACALFCECKPDCSITIDRVFGVMEARLQAYIQPPSLTGLVDLIEFVSGVQQNASIVVDLAFFASWGMVKLANYLFGLDRVKTLPTLLALAADEPSNDWELLCTECEPDPGEIEIFLDPAFPNVPFGTLVLNSPGNYTATAEQWLPVNGGDGYYRVAVKALAGQTASYTWTGATAPAGAIFSGYWNTGSGVRQTGDTPDGTGGRWAVYHISTLPFVLNIEVTSP